MCLAVVTGCGGASTTTSAREPDPRPANEAPQPPRATAPHASARELLGVTGPDQPWAEMSAQDRELYMIGKILPILAEMFAEAGPEAGQQLTCESCHGPRPQTRDFVMPSPALPPVPPPGTQAYAALRQTKTRSVRFMEEQVTPTMATLLGRTSGQGGFGCRSCHRTP